MAERVEAVRFTSLGFPAVELVGQVHLPVEARGRIPGVVLCHPQPLVADMDDPLVVALAHHLAEAGMVALRFNFRGVAPSGGEATDGRLEPLDVGGAVAWLRRLPMVDGDRIALAGHAFGAIAALSYANVDHAITTVVAISPPHFRLISGFATEITCPVQVVVGDDDEVSPRFKVEPWLATLAASHALTVMPQAQHLMHGREGVVARRIVPLFSQQARAH